VGYQLGGAVYGFTLYFRYREGRIVGCTTYIPVRLSIYAGQLGMTSVPLTSLDVIYYYYQAIGYWKSDSSSAFKNILMAKPGD
jgi:hypothetical protein